MSEHKVKRVSYRRRILQDMRNIFEELNSIPHETRRSWGSFGTWSDYGLYIEEIDKTLQQLEKNRLRRA